MKGPKFTTLWMLGVFVAGSLMHWRHHPHMAKIFWIAGLVVGISGVLFPNHMRGFEKGWMRLIAFINKIISRVLTVFIFYAVLTPLALIFQIFRRDALRLRQPKTPTYWQPHEKITDADYYRHLY